MSREGLAITDLFVHRNNPDVIVNDRIALAWERDRNKDLYAQELIDLHRCSLVLEDEYSNNSELAVGRTIPSTNNINSNVRHLGMGVFVQSNTLGIDSDSELYPQTITTSEIRYFSRLCLEASTSTKLVLGTGHPGIGKTRGALAYTLQELLCRGEAVMRVGYKDESVYLFLPFTGPNGTNTYRVWCGVAESWYISLFASQKMVFALIDPPEDPHYKRAAKCRVIEYCPNNEERHLKNAYKDGHVIVMGVPSLNEMLCMTSILWSDKSRIRTCQNSSSFTTMEEQYDEVTRRCALLGSVPRLVFRGAVFLTTLDDIRRQAASLCLALNPEELVHVYNGGTTGVKKQTISEMSRFFIIKPRDETYDFSADVDLDLRLELRGSPKVFLNQATVYHVRETLRSKLSAMTGADAFQFGEICAMLLKGGTWNNICYPARATILCGASLEHTTALILALPSDSSGNVLIRASNCYPVLDFASSPTTWFNAKVGPKKPNLGLGAFVTVMQYLNFAAISDNNELILLDNEKKISLTMIRNTDVSGDDDGYSTDTRLPQKYQAMNVEQIKAVLRKVVKVQFIDTKQWSPRDALDAQVDAIKGYLDRYPSDF
jgi:hypothetical protein